MGKVVKHILTKGNLPLCNCSNSCAEYLDCGWPARQNSDACLHCMRIYKIMRKAMRTTWTRERLDRLPDLVLKLIDDEVKKTYKKKDADIE